MGQSSCRQVESVKHSRSNKTMYENVKNNAHTKTKNQNRDKVVNTRVFQRTSPVSNYGEKCESGQESIIPKQSVKLSIENVEIDKFDERCDKPPGLISNVDKNNSKFTQVTSRGVENSETNVFFFFFFYCSKCRVYKDIGCNDYIDFSLHNNLYK